MLQESENNIIEWVNQTLTKWGCSEHMAHVIDEWVVLLLIILLALVVDIVLRQVVLRIVSKIVHKTSAKWDDMLFTHNVLVRMCSIVIPIIIYALLPIAFPDEDSHNLLSIIISRGVEVYIVVAFVRFFNSIIRMAFAIADTRPALHGRPIKGLMQTGQVIIMMIATSM